MGRLERLFNRLWNWNQDENTKIRGATHLLLLGRPLADWSVRTKVGMCQVNSCSEASPKDEDDHKDHHNDNKPAGDKHVAAKVAPKTNCKTSARRSETGGSSEEVASWRPRV